MAINPLELAFDVEDLVLDDMAVTAMRDAVALPETGASQSCSCCGSCCCCQPPQPELPSN
ncbi:thiazolylpeptide-type bacteriocin [Saccharothrix obliqua]|uniref:thiazolylpeptide-type bacteriocin n=1 Tax=Saccharothrix obliqua TaxID=2861747 RepID=UPI0021507A05|nr:thiazolylpeptide-type bacteriocin [Saccharothrix obliqua]